MKHLSCLEERLLDIEIPFTRFNNLTKDERNAMYSLKDDKSITIKDANKDAAVIVWGHGDYLKERSKQLVSNKGTWGFVTGHTKLFLSKKPQICNVLLII